MIVSPSKPSAQYVRAGASVGGTSVGGGSVGGGAAVGGTSVDNNCGDFDGTLSYGIEFKRNTSFFS
jgi:hypothetical protein